MFKTIFVFNIFFFFSELVSPEVEKELRSLYLSLNELLRHFWHSFPPTTPEAEAKVVKMHEAIHRFQVAKVKPFEVRFATNFADTTKNAILLLLIASFKQTLKTYMRLNKSWNKSSFFAFSLRRYHHYRFLNRNQSVAEPM